MYLDNNTSILRIENNMWVNPHNCKQINNENEREEKHH